MRLSLKITGEFVWPPALDSDRQIVARIRVEDVSRADGAARAVGETRLIDMRHGQRRPDVVPFSVDVTDLSPRSEYALRVHLDVDGDGVVSPGDWVSSERVSVGPDALVAPRISLRRVG